MLKIKYVEIDIHCMKVNFVSRYTPRLMSPEVLENIFVQRQELAIELVERIRESVLTQALHHTLLIGPRGIGKTHLVSLIYHRICEMDDLRDCLFIAWLNEEEWSVTSFLDFLLCIFQALEENAKTLRGKQSCALTEGVEALYKLPAEVAEETGVKLLKEFIENSPNSPTLLLIVENLDDLFAGLGKDGQKQLHDFLETTNCVILATAQCEIKEIKQKNSPFYGFFRDEKLKDLNAEDATQLLANLATHNGKNELASFIKTPTGRDRIQALYFLAGGNHRIYVIFSEFLTRRESLDELVEAFMRMLDDLTPYYQERMRFLSPQQRKIIDFLCDRRHAVTVKEIAQRGFITHQTASSQLKKLLEMGYVRTEAYGRESFYELRAPLMRFCLKAKKQRGEPIQLIVDFLRRWYTKTELQEQLELLSPDAQLEREYLLHALRESEEENKDPHVKLYLKEYKAYFDKKDFVNALPIAEKLVAIRGHAQDWFEQGYILFSLERYEEALASLDKGINLEPNNVNAWSFRGILLNIMSCHEQALQSYERALELNPNDQDAWSFQGMTLATLKRYEEALASFNTAFELSPNKAREASDWYELGNVQRELGRYEEALASFDKALEIDSEHKSTWVLKAATLVITKRWDKALISLDKVIEFKPNDANVLVLRGWLLNIFNHYEEALKSFDKAIALGLESSWIFFCRVEALIALNRWDEGINTLEEALNRLEDGQELRAETMVFIICNLFTNIQDTAMWKTRFTSLITLSDKHQVISALGQGLVQSIPIFMSEMVSDKAAQVWLEMWQELASNYDELQIPLRLLDAAVRYREKRDQRVLLSLAIEERKLLEQVLGIDK